MAASSRRRRQIMPPVVSMGSLVKGLTALVLLIVVFLVCNPSLDPSKRSSDTLFDDPAAIPPKVLLNLDAIVILGGGKPSSLDQPPTYVQRRCDDAVAVWTARHQRTAPTKRHKRRSHHETSASVITAQDDVPILCLSAGTAHLPQLMDTNSGLPIWEATSTAAYLSMRHNHSTNVFVETTSYDTIGNAFFARTSHTDIVGWRRLLIVTNEFHMARTRAIFDWVFGLDPIAGAPYKLYYLQSPNVGLSDDALAARRTKEAKSEATIHAMAKQSHHLRDVWSFLNTQHDFYTAQKLVERAQQKPGQSSSTANELVQKSYGGAL